MTLTMSGVGTLSDPWDLATALASVKIKPGHTLWLMGGTYVGDFTVSLSGTSAKPILIRPRPGERVIIQGSGDINVPILKITGSYVRVIGFEVCNAPSARYTESTGDLPVGLGLQDGIDPTGVGVEIINCVIHDTAQGTFWTNTATAGMFYGCLFFNIGWLNPIRGSGHALYSQNYSGTRIVRHNLFMSGYGYGIHIFGSQSQRGYDLDGNAHLAQSFLIGGEEAFDTIIFRNNITYGADLALGQSSSANNGALTLDNNRLLNPAGRCLTIKRWLDVDAHDNTFLSSDAPAGSRPVLTLFPPAGAATEVWADNAMYYIGTRTHPFNVDGVADLNISEWRTRTGENGPYATTLPQAFVEVTANEYNALRATVVIYNPIESDTVSVDLSGLSLAPGSYRLRNAANYLNEWHEFIYSEELVNVPMTGWTVAIPIGASQPLSVTTFPEFGIFILEQIVPEIVFIRPHGTDIYTKIDGVKTLVSKYAGSAL